MRESTSGLYVLGAGEQEWYGDWEMVGVGIPLLIGVKEGRPAFG